MRTAKGSLGSVLSRGYFGSPSRLRTRARCESVVRAAAGRKSNEKKSKRGGKYSISHPGNWRLKPRVLLKNLRLV